MKIYALIMPKGGAGKSTFCVNLAALNPELKTIIFDCDPQASSQAWFDARPEEKEHPKCLATDAKNLHTFIAQAAEQGYEQVFIDSAGRDAPSNKIIAQLSDVVIMPCQPSAFDLHAINDAIASTGKDKDKLKLVVNHGFSQGNRNQQAIDLLSSLDGGSVSPIVIVRRAIYQDAGAMGLSVNEMEPNSKAANEINQLWEWVNNG